MMLKICYVADGGSPQLVFEGEISADQTGHVFDAAVTAPEFQQGVGLVIDMSEHHNPFSHEEIRRLAAHAAGQRDLLGRRKAVVVLPDNDLQYGLARMFSTYAELNGLSVEVFTANDEALRWLRAAPDP
jgi:hypothetical protein